MFCPLALPTSKTCLLPVAFAIMEKQGEKSTTTYGQQLTARLTATVAVAFFAAVDAACHTVCAVVKTVPALFRATIAKVAGFDQKISSKLSGTEVFAHVQTAYNSALMVPSALWGFTRPAVVLQIGVAAGLRGTLGTEASGAIVSGCAV